MSSRAVEMLSPNIKATKLLEHTCNTFIKTLLLKDVYTDSEQKIIRSQGTLFCSEL